MILLQLFLEFMRTGAFAVGGGLATLPFLYDISDRTGWFSHLDLMNMLAVSESTPGPIGVNTATYVGYTTAGLPGALIATAGLVVPSIIVIILVARMLERFRSNPLVARTFYGLRPASAGLIAAAGVGVARTSLLYTGVFVLSNPLQLVKINSVLLAVVLYFAIRKWKNLHPVVFIAASAAVGIVLRLE